MSNHGGDEGEFGTDDDSSEDDPFEDSVGEEPNGSEDSEIGFVESEDESPSTISQSRNTSSHSGKGADEKYCSSCGSVIKKEAELCPECGVRQEQPSSSEEKNPGLAAAGSFFFTGLGQIYNGEIGKGLLFIFVQFINILLMFVVIGFLTFPLVWVYGIYDAYKSAEAINEGKK